LSILSTYLTYHEAEYFAGISTRVFDYLKTYAMRLVAIFTIALLISSCGKDNVPLPYTFAGQVITDKAGNAVGNATVELLAYYKSTNAITPGGLYKLATAKTNSSGEFMVRFDQSDGIKYYQVNVFADNYFPFVKEYIDTSNFQNRQFIYNPRVFKLATIKISFRNSSPISNTDEFTVFQENELFGGGFDTFIARQFTGGTFKELEHRYVGSSIQGYEVTKTKGDTMTYINWNSKKNGLLNYTRDSVYIASGTEGSYTVNY
jgi:hypothetical protein